MVSDNRADASTSSTDPLPAHFRMTDLDEILFAPGGGERAKQILQRIEQLQLELATQIRDGLPPERYQQAQIIANSLAAARDLLVRVFKLFERG
jgi:hypothetical protein